MKILAWMQHKLSGRNGTNRPCPNAAVLQFDAGQPEAPKEETHDWPHGLLAIGTLGSNGTVKQAPHPTSPSCGAAHVPAAAPYCLDTVSAKEVISSNTKISKRSLSFLVKKAFVCREGFSLPPTSPRGFADQLPTDSTMEKILRAILNKKIYPQNPSPNPAATAVSKKMYLQNNRHKRPSQSKQTDTEPESHDHGTDHRLQMTYDNNNNHHDNPSKWDKTDSEYIVLEI